MEKSLGKVLERALEHAVQRLLQARWLDAHPSDGPRRRGQAAEEEDSWVRQKRPSIESVVAPLRSETSPSHSHMMLPPFAQEKSLDSSHESGSGHLRSLLAGGEERSSAEGSAAPYRSLRLQKLCDGLPALDLNVVKGHACKDRGHGGAQGSTALPSGSGKTTPGSPDSETESPRGASHVSGLARAAPADSAPACSNTKGFSPCKNRQFPAEEMKSRPMPVGLGDVASRRLMALSYGSEKPKACGISSSASCRSTAPALWPIWRESPEGSEVSECDDNEVGTPGKAVKTQLDIAARLRGMEFQRLHSCGSWPSAGRTSVGPGFGRRASVLRSGNWGMQRFMMHPTSNPILFWLIIASVLIAYDLVTIPMHNLPWGESMVLDTIAFVAAIYWSLDTVRSFFTGFETEEAVDLRPREVAKHYLRTWFALDLLTCVLDWIFLLVGTGGAFNKFWRTGRALRAWRLLCLLRLVRVVKLFQRIEELMDRFQSVQAFIVMRGFWIFVAVLFMCHYMACYWYATADLLSDPDDPNSQTWVKDQGLESADWGQVYLISVHWALSQSGFAQSEIYPVSAAERVYASCTSILWIIIVSVTINLFNVWLGQLRDANMDKVTQKMRLRKYLAEHECSRTLTFKVLQCFRSKYNTSKRRVHEGDIEFFRDLPIPLQICLHTEVYMPILKPHPFFQMVGESVLTLVCHLATGEHRFLAGEVVFREGEVARQMLKVMLGKLDYCAVSWNVETSQLSAGDWVCEQAFWMRWVLRGRLVAKCSCELVSIDVAKFHAIMQDAKCKGEDLDNVRTFAVNVFDHLCATNPETDLFDRQEIEGLVRESTCS